MKTFDITYCFVNDQHGTSRIYRVEAENEPSALNKFYAKKNEPVALKGCKEVIIFKKLTLWQKIWNAIIFGV